MVSLIVAVTEPKVNSDYSTSYVIGVNEKMPWHVSSDLKWFKKTTENHVVIMGRNTYESSSNFPLKNRINIVVTSHEIDVPEDRKNDVIAVKSVEEAICVAKFENEKLNRPDDEIFIIGGEQIYTYVIQNRLIDYLYVDFLIGLKDIIESTYALHKNYITFSNNFKKKLLVKEEYNVEQNVAHVVKYEYDRSNEYDSKYIALVREIIRDGSVKKTRSGDTRSLFGKQIRLDLGNGLPILTTKKVFSKGCIYELIWFLKGGKNIKYLVDNNVHIWDDDAYRYFKQNICKSSNMSKEEFIEHVKNEDKLINYTFGDLGPIYGKQWTDWNGKNQIENIIKTLKENPDDRRILLTAWNVGEIDEMALPPCHYCCQFYTRVLENGKRELSCMFHMRSVDVCCGLPFNILSYAILTHMIAQCVDMVPGELIFDGGDVHIYENHVETFLNEQACNSQYYYKLPRLFLNKEKNNIFDFKPDDIKIEGYESYPQVKYELNVGL